MVKTTDIVFEKGERPKPVTPAEKLEYALATQRHPKDVVAAIVELIRQEIDARTKLGSK